MAEDQLGFLRLRQRASQRSLIAEDIYARASANYGLWAGSYVHGDLTAMREPAQAFLRDVELQPGSPEAGAAHRVYGVTLWFTGNFIEARSHLEQALAIFDPERDRDVAFRFGLMRAPSLRSEFAIPIGSRDPAIHEEVAAGDEPTVGAHEQRTHGSNFVRAFQWVQVPPGDRSSRKQPKQSWR